MLVIQYSLGGGLLTYDAEDEPGALPEDDVRVGDLDLAVDGQLTGLLTPAPHHHHHQCKRRDKYFPSRIKQPTDMYLSCALFIVNKRSYYILALVFLNTSFDHEGRLKMIQINLQ